MLDLFLRRHVEFQGLPLPVYFLQLRHHLPGGLQIEIGHHHEVTFQGKLKAQRPPQSGTTTGNDCDSRFGHAPDTLVG